MVAVRVVLVIGMNRAATEAQIARHITVPQAYAITAGMWMVASMAALGVGWFTYRRLAAQ